MSKSFDLTKWLSDSAEKVNQALDFYLPPENQKPTTLHKAMRYSVFAGGKRVRPAVLLAATEACEGDRESALPLACAIECIHTYSLIHDDLPAMDNDDFRRGKLTSHKAFGEGIAILAGDGLLTEAFAIASRWKATERYTHKEITAELAHHSGSLQMVGGQAIDLESEGKAISLEELKYIHERKTSALLCLSTRLGAMNANATPEQLEALTTFGYKVGLAFQIIDDILDVTQSSEKLGKTAGKDAEVQKATYPALLGLEKSKTLASELTQDAFSILEIFGDKAAALRALAQYLLKRDH
ncbi:MAG: polyprenyl synthetase family protein [Limisphaerales bacterium]|jgi:geranylgeranyl diphosphate synthase type II|nr:polyprenyl synthetase family protein [Verrucomicrobiota bacterium]